jgi:protein tyrosine phosphatase (PTP) superfamily phosphohydrolase (DUF442 family)
MGALMQINWVTPDLAVSGRQPKTAVYDMQRQGITDVINLTIRHDPNWPFRTLNDGTPDDGQHKTSAWFGPAIHAALRAIHNGGKVLIHCESGVHRSPSMAYAVLRAMGRSNAEASHLVLKAIPKAQLRYAADAEEALHDLQLVTND